MDTRKIKKLIDLVKETGIGELEVKSGEESVRITCQGAMAPSAAPTQPSIAPAAPQPKALTPEPASEPVTPKKEVPPGHEVKSPMVGTVYISSTPGAAPFVKIGQHVDVGETLCLIEAMKMFNKIEADRAGTVSARLIENEAPVEYDQPLFIIESSE